MHLTQVSFSAGKIGIEDTFLELDCLVESEFFVVLVFLVAQFDALEG